LLLDLNHALEISGWQWRKYSDLQAGFRQKFGRGNLTVCPTELVVTEQLMVGSSVFQGLVAARSKSRQADALEDKVVIACILYLLLGACGYMYDIAGTHCDRLVIACCQQSFAHPDDIPFIDGKPVKFGADSWHDAYFGQRKIADRFVVDQFANVTALARQEFRRVARKYFDCHLPIPFPCRKTDNILDRNLNDKAPP